MQGEKREKGRKNIWNNNVWEYSKINDKHQSTYPESSENTKQIKYQKTTSGNIICKLQKTIIKHEIFKEAKERNYYRGVPVEEQG